MYFEKELGYIKNDEIRQIAEEGIALIPDYFYHVPASSSGKHHPSYALGEGGLYRHVQAAIGIAVELFRIYKFGQEEQDLIVASLILHDGWKQGLDGNGGHTLHEHPIIAVEQLSVITGELGTNRFHYLVCITMNIASHMGQWTTSEYSDVVLPYPASDMQGFVHLCDYLASRKCLEFNFNL